MIADLYHVTTRTVKQQVAPLVFRYDNNDVYTKVDSREATAPGLASVFGHGNGAITSSPFTPQISATPIVSIETTVTGDKPAELPVENETSFNLTTRKDPWHAGEKAEFTVQAPFAGVAWVCVETDKLLDTHVRPALRECRAHRDPG